jgi:hypothetical protein
MTDGPKWTDIAIVILTIGIVFFALMQWLEMRGAGHQTDQLVEYAKTQAKASQDIATAASNFSATAEESVAEFKKAAAESNKAADEAVRNTKISIRNAQDAFRDDQRAWVGLGQYRIDHFDDKDAFKLVLPWVNSGKTPAINAEVSVAYAFPRFRLPGPPEHKYLFEKASAIAPQGIYVTNIANSAVPPLFASISDGTIWMYFFGAFRYHDVHSGIEHTTTFCLYYDKATKTMAFCENGNDMG